MSGCAQDFSGRDFSRQALRRSQALYKAVAPVTKSELIEEVARQAPEISKRDVEIIVNTIFDSMTEALARHDRIEIRGFGSFIAKPRRAREGRNPRTGEKVQVPHKWVPFFTVGKELRKRINRGVDERPARTPADVKAPAKVEALTDG